MFRRRRSQDSPDPSAGGGETDGTELDADGDTDATLPPGPYDVSEAPQDDIVRLDLGGLLVPGVEGMELRLDVDEASEQVVAVTVVHGESALQIMAFAAPRTTGIWDDVREEIRVSLAAQGPVEESSGTFGRELLATLVVAGPQGQSGMQPVRFVGVDGPRWFVRGLFSGPAARQAAAAEPLEDVLRASVVVRGGDPMAPGDPLMLHVPGEIPEGMNRTGPDGREMLPPPERGPESLRFAEPQAVLASRALATARPNAPRSWLIASRSTTTRLARGIASAQARATEAGCIGSSARATTATGPVIRRSSSIVGPRDLAAASSASASEPSLYARPTRSQASTTHRGGDRVRPQVAEQRRASAGPDVEGGGRRRGRDPARPSGPSGHHQSQRRVDAGVRRPHRHRVRAERDAGDHGGRRVARSAGERVRGVLDRARHTRSDHVRSRRDRLGEQACDHVGCRAQAGAGGSPWSPA